MEDLLKAPFSILLTPVLRGARAAEMANKSAVQHRLLFHQVGVGGLAGNKRGYQLCSVVVPDNFREESHN